MSHVDWISGELGHMLLRPESMMEPSSHQDITLFKSVGTAIQDVVTAQAVLKAAIAKNRGVVAEL